MAAGGFVARSFEAMLRECGSYKKYSPLQTGIRTFLGTLLWNYDASDVFKFALVVFLPLLYFFYFWLFWADWSCRTWYRKAHLLLRALRLCLSDVKVFLSLGCLANVFCCSESGKGFNQEAGIAESEQFSSASSNQRCSNHN